MFYVYAIVDEQGQPIYIGKGSGRRRYISAKRHGGTSTILKWARSETEAYKAEIKFIAKHSPPLNQCGGGGGARSTRRVVRKSAEYLLMDKIGTRAYAARFLLTRIDERNCGQFGLSKIDVSGWRQTALNDITHQAVMIAGNGL